MRQIAREKKGENLLSCVVAHETWEMWDWEGQEGLGVAISLLRE